MTKIMKCSGCKELIPYESRYENGDFEFLLDAEKKFVGQIKDDKVYCVKCGIDD